MAVRFNRNATRIIAAGTVVGLGAAGAGAQITGSPGNSGVEPIELGSTTSTSVTAPSTDPTVVPSTTIADGLDRADDTPDDSIDDTPDDPPEEALDDTPDDSPADSPDISPDDTPDVSPDISPDDSPDVSPDNSPDVSPDDSPDVSADSPDDSADDSDGSNDS